MRPSKKSRTTKKYRFGKHADQDNTNSLDSFRKSGKNGGKGGLDGMSASFCLWPPHDSRDIWHFSKASKACSGHEKKAIVKRIVEEKAATDSARNKPLQKLVTDVKEEDKTVNSVTTLSKADNVAIKRTSTNSAKLHDARGRTDDGAEDSIVPSRIVIKNVFDGFTRLHITVLFQKCVWLTVRNTAPYICIV